MAFTYKSKRMAYDNISVGNATGKEFIIAAGASDGDFTTKPNKDSGGNTSTSALAEARRENLIKGDNESTNDYPQVPGQTSATSGHTSGSSLTSSFPENVG